ncbi:MAG: MBL fold metallo-hydrolase [Pyrinomonadaceae bacterium]
MLNAQPIIRRTKFSEIWQVSLLTSGELFRASSLLATNGVDIAVFDTGLPQHSNSFIAALEKFGVAPEDVTLVFNTHAHVDHSHNNSLFENARIFCSRLDREWTRSFQETLARFENPAERDVLAFYPETANYQFDSKIFRKVLAIEKLVWDATRWGRDGQTCWLEENSLPDGINVLPTPGHAPHHVSYIIQTEQRPVLLCGDALLVRDEENANLSLIPPHDLAAYKHSQTLVKAFDGIIVPGHDAPFDNQLFNK